MSIILSPAILTAARLGGVNWRRAAEGWPRPRRRGWCPGDRKGGAARSLMSVSEIAAWRVLAGVMRSLPTPRHPGNPWAETIGPAPGRRPSARPCIDRWGVEEWLNERRFQTVSSTNSALCRTPRSLPRDNLEPGTAFVGSAAGGRRRGGEMRCSGAAQPRIQAHPRPLGRQSLPPVRRRVTDLTEPRMPDGRGRETSVRGRCDGAPAGSGPSARFSRIRPCPLSAPGPSWRRTW